MNRSVENRINIIGGSSLVHLSEDSQWGCRRQLAYLFLGYPKSEEKVYTEAMQLGHHLEPLLRDYFSNFMEVKCVETECFYHKELPFIGGHPDGIFGNNGIIEIKTANPNSFLTLYRKGIYEAYKDQLTLYMGLTNRHDAYFVVGNSMNISENKFILSFDWDENRYNKIIDDILNFVCDITTGELPDRCGKRKKGLLGICIKCEYLTLCSPKIPNKQFKNGESK